jgi:peptidoglycan/xylan/chitin deacetylase (PgdA/CDA1 family)
VYVVYFHNICTASRDPFDGQTPRQSALTFEQDVEWLRQRFELIGFDECLDRVERRRYDERLAALCFDDGHLGIHRHAFPVLESIAVRAGVFLMRDSGIPEPISPLLHFERLEIGFRLTRCTRLHRHDVEMPTLAQRAVVFGAARQRLKRFENETRIRHQDKLLADLGVEPERILAFARQDPERFAKIGPREAADLDAAGWVLGAHTRTHPVLARTDDRGRSWEIGSPAEHGRAGDRMPFAYPYGGTEHCDVGVARAVEAAGFHCAFTTVAGACRSEHDSFLLPRVTVRELRREARDSTTAPGLG